MSGMVSLDSLAAGPGLAFLANSLSAGSGSNDRLSVVQIMVTTGLALFVTVTSIIALRRRPGSGSEVEPAADEESHRAMSGSYVDPGWLPALAKVSIARRPRAKKSAPDGVLVIRVLFIAYLLSAFLILFVLTFVIDRLGTPDLELALVIVVFGIGGVVAALWTTRRELDVSSVSSLALSYRTNFFLGFAWNQAPLMLTFVLCFIRNQQWPYLAGLPLYLIGMAIIAPGVHNLECRQNQVSQRGSSLSVGRVLSLPPRKFRS
jgi:hypothetical protein